MRHLAKQNKICVWNSSIPFLCISNTLIFSINCHHLLIHRLLQSENDNTVYFPKSSLPQSSERNSFDSNNKKASQDLSNSSFEKIPWNRGTNVLVDVLLSLSAKFQLKGQSPMSATNEQIQSLITNNFVDKNGNDFSEETINSYLKPAHSDKLPKDKSPKKIDLSGFFTEESNS